MEHYIKDKVIIVTGGSSGFGLEAARMLLEMDATVIITGRNTERLAAAESELASDNLMAVQADACSTDDWKSLIDKVLDRHGQIDVLVNNHGAGVKIANVEDMEDDDIQAVLDVNIISVMKGCREVVRVMKKQKSGHIVNVSSGCAYHSWPMWGAYTVAKAGMVGFTRCLHLEMIEWGGKATTFIPGAANTNFCDAAGIDNSWVADYPSAADFARSLVQAIDVPERTFVEEVNVWGVQQNLDHLNPF